jgi:hypothetical protein
MKVAFIAPTGSGKSTAAALVHDLYPASVNIKLAAPLYELQAYIYSRVGAGLKGDQDGELLQFLGHKIQREAPDFLANEFRKIFLSVNGVAPVITNDDCRPHNYEALRSLGFVFVRILGPVRARFDHLSVDPSHPVEKGICDLDCGFVLYNSGSISEYRANIREVLNRISCDRERQGR